MRSLYSGYISAEVGKHFSTVGRIEDFIATEGRMLVLHILPGFFKAF